MKKIKLAGDDLPGEVFTRAGEISHRVTEEYYKYTAKDKFRAYLSGALSVLGHSRGPLHELPSRLRSPLRTDWVFANAIRRAMSEIVEENHIELTSAEQKSLEPMPS